MIPGQFQATPKEILGDAVPKISENLEKIQKNF